MPRIRIFCPERGIGFSGQLACRTILVLVIIFALSPQLKAQKWAGFWRLTGPERCWVLGHLRVAGKAQHISLRTSQLADSVSTLPGMDRNWNGGLADAFRHSMWMAMLTREIGAKKADKLGRAHEKGNYRTWKKSQLEDGVLADATATEMDLWNNGQGIEIAQELGKQASDQQLIQAILDRMAAGKMRVILTDSYENFLDQNNEMIPKEKWYGLWENPRVLTPSRMN